MSKPAKQQINPHYPKLTQQQQLLSVAIERDCQYLLATIQVYVSKALKQFGRSFGITCDRHSIQTVAQEILSETVKTALEKAETFDSNCLPTPWLLGIARNKILHWQRKQTQESKRITPIAELPQIRKIKQQHNIEKLSEEELLGLLHQSFEFSPDSQQMLEYLLSLATDSDRQVLQLAFVDGLNGKSLAAALGTTEGAAYTKKHRALERLRQAYARTNQDLEEGR